MSARELEAIKILKDNYNIQGIQDFKIVDYSIYLQRMSEKLKKWYLNLSLNDYSSYELNTNINYLHNGRLCTRISVTRGIGLMGKVSKNDENEILDLLIYFLKFLEKLTNKNLCLKLFLPFYSFESNDDFYIYVIVINNPGIKDSDLEIINIYLNQFKNKYKVNSKQYI